MKERFWQAAAIAFAVALVLGNWHHIERGEAAPLPIPFLNRNQQPETAELQVRVIDARSKQPLAGAEVVLLETEQRMTTDVNGRTPVIQAPIVRDPRYRRRLAELHGQMTLIAYKNGYRDTVFFGVRMHPGRRTEPEIWMYQITPDDRRIEPIWYMTPIHRLWLIDLAQTFRSSTQPGAGPESPGR